MPVQAGKGPIAATRGSQLLSPEVLKLAPIACCSQVAEREAGGGKPTFMGTARQLIAEDGARGLLRGLVPRMVNVALWGEPACLLKLPDCWSAEAAQWGLRREA